MKIPDSVDTLEQYLREVIRNVINKRSSKPIQIGLPNATHFYATVTELW